MIGVSKLRTDYKVHESRRQLCSSYDMFLADSRVIPMLPRLLGKAFFSKKKQPVPVDITKADWVGQIQKALGSTYMFKSGGSCMVIRAARSSMDPQSIVENLMAVATGVAGSIPRKWANVQVRGRLCVRARVRLVLNVVPGGSMAAPVAAFS